MQKPLARIGLTLHDVDLMELNDSFARQAVAMARQPGHRRAGRARVRPPCCSASA
ncbi:hypothetical protein [Rhodopila globiformis]|uniref:Uncharacterized protein n=1 Tax=Rhodopila globiformis TaxID=1071 RepID=A0A2S6MWE4_RHOGL|nr:hypothetical protein [Rhodopila globiformis]PPQ26683.1 hypothetical protein CCS01_29410 [Rhodopila globiformis]